MTFFLPDRTLALLRLRLFLRLTLQRLFGLPDLLQPPLPVRKFLRQLVAAPVCAVLRVFLCI